MYSLNIATIAKQIQGLMKRSSATEATISKLTTVSSDEYDTGRRFGDEIIYGKIFEIENLPNQTTATIDHGIDNIKDIFDITLVVQISSGLAARIFTYTQSNYVTIGATQITIATNMNLSSNAGIVKVEYTKAAAGLLSPNPDDERSIETPDEKLNIEETPDEEVQEVKKTTRKKS